MSAYEELIEHIGGFIHPPEEYEKALALVNKSNTEAYKKGKTDAYNDVALHAEESVRRLGKGRLL